jgi:hypothetical protein
MIFTRRQRYPRAGGTMIRTAIRNNLKPKQIG